MKIRNGFVSNSSSSSFIVIDAKKGFDKPNFGNTLVVDKHFGETEFGWGPDELDKVEDKIIFSYLQILYKEEDKKDAYDWLAMLETIIRENTTVKDIEWYISLDYKSISWSYIDHASAYPDNCEMFKNKQTLKDFIFGNDSKIVLDNDNH